MAIEFEVSRVQVDKPRGAIVSIHNLDFDPPGEQTETELESIALKQAKLIFEQAALSI